MVTSFIKALDINDAYECVEQLTHMNDLSKESGIFIEIDYFFHIGPNNMIIEVIYFNENDKYKRNS